MGKLVYLVMIVIAVQLSLLLVFGQAIPGSTLWDLFTSPASNWDNLSLTSLISDTITAISAVAIIIGTFWVKYDFLVFAGISGVFLSFGVVLSNVWQQIKSQAAATGNGGLIASLVVGPIIFLYILTILEFWRGRD